MGDQRGSLDDLAILRNSVPELYGAKVFLYPGVGDPVSHVENLRKFSMREDDVIIIGAPKSGNHWLWEITQMLLRQTTKHETRTKEHVQVDNPEGLARAEKEHSPRVLNSHNVMVHLPQEIILKKIKIIHVIRNPKDTIVSAYWHLKNTYNMEDVQLQTLLDAATADVKIQTSQLEFLQQISEFERSHPNHPVKHIYYEAMKKDPLRTLQDLAQFLNVPASDDFCQDVANACSFDQMKRLEETGAKVQPDEFQAFHKAMNYGELKFCRKGIIGDWKNHLTVAQSEQFDKYIAAYLKKKDLKFTFIYE